MPQDVALVGNARILGRVRPDGVLDDAFFPSKGFHHHILHSQFGVYLYEEGRATWLASDWSGRQTYLEDTFVVQGMYRHEADLEARLLDFVPPQHDVFVRIFEIRNRSNRPRELGVLHAEAAALEENHGDFGFNAAYVDRQHRVLRYRGHPFDNTREAHCCLLVGASPPPNEFQVGRSYEEEGPHADAFHDAADGALSGNALCPGSREGATSAYLWRVTLPPGGSARFYVYLAGGADTRDAEERLDKAIVEGAEALLDASRLDSRRWIARAKEALQHGPTPELRQLARRSLLMLRLLQHEDGAFLAAPTLYPDYRYCWPRDAAYMAWMMSEYGYREEAENFFRWCVHAQDANGFWHQNYYTDRRPHWTALQIDQVGTILWALGQHLRRYGDIDLARELVPMIVGAGDGLLRLMDPRTALISTSQDLWEECGGVFTYSNAACAAGLLGAAYACALAGEPDPHRRFSAAAEQMAHGIRTGLAPEGHLVGEMDRHATHSAREEYLHDISLVGLAVPYALVQPDWPPLAQEARAMCTAFDWDAGGLGRYPGDHFEGGNPWPLCSMWMAAYFLAAGDTRSAMEHLEWALAQVTPLGHFPEQVHRDSSHPVSALPLGWAHAWFLWLYRDLWSVAPVIKNGADRRKRAGWRRAGDARPSAPPAGSPEKRAPSLLSLLGSSSRRGE